MANEHIDIDITATDYVTPAVRTAIKSLDDLGDKAAGAAPKVAALDHAQEEASDSATQLATRASVAEKRVKALGNESVKTGAKVAALDKKMDNVDKAGKKKGWFGGLHGGIKFTKMLKMLMIPAIFDAVGALATLGSAAGAMASAAVGALGPLTGLLTAYPGYLAAIGQGLITFKLGLGSALEAAKALSNSNASPEEIAKAMGGLSPKTQALARNMAGLIKPFDAVKKKITEEMAPGFNDLIKALKGYIPMVRGSLLGTAQVISDTATRLGYFMREVNTQANIGAIMGTNNRIIAEFGNMSVHALRALLNVLEPAGSMLIRFAQDLTRFMGRVADMTNNRAGLTQFYDKTYKITKNLIQVTTDLGVALFNVFKEGAQLGGEMGYSLAGMVKRFREFTESLEGKQSIRNWFATMKPIIWEVGYLIRDIGKALASVSMDKTLLGTLQTLRLDTLPALVGMLHNASGKLLPSIAKALGSIASIMVDLQIGPAILSMMANALETIAAIVHSLPGPLKTILGYMVTLGSLMKVSGFIGLGGLFSKGGKEGAKGLGLLSKGATAVSTAIKDVANHTLTAGAAFAQLKTSAKTSLGPLLTKAGWIGVALGVAYFVSNVWSGLSAMNEMNKAAKQLKADLDQGFTAEGLTELSDQIAAVAGEWQSYSDMMNGRNPIRALADKRLWGDIWRQIFTVDPTYGEEYEKLYGDLTQVQTTYYGAIQKMMDSTGEGSLEYWEQVAQSAGVNATMGVNQMVGAMSRYDNATRRAAPAVRDMYGALNTLGAAASDAATKADAFGTVMTSLQDILTGGRSAQRNTLIEIKREREQLNNALSQADFNKKLTNRSNYEINDLLTSQAAKVTELTRLEMLRTGETDKAVQKYREQYDILKNKISKAMTVAGIENADAKAQKLLDKFLAAPKYLQRALNDPALKTMIETGRYSYDELRDYIKTHPIYPKVKIRHKIKKGDLGLGGMGDVSMATGATTTESVAVRVTGESKAVGDIQTVKDAMSALEADPARPVIDTSSIKDGTAELRFLANEIDKMKDIGIGVSVDVSRNRWAGGPVLGGVQYIVGERGPEMFVPRAGTPFVVGQHGQEQRTFQQPGVIIPNHELAVRTLPNEAAQRDIKPPQQASGSGQYSLGSSAPVVNIGTINAKSEFDVVKAVRRGITEAERDRRERT